MPIFSKKLKTKNAITLKCCQPDRFLRNDNSQSLADVRKIDPLRTLYVREQTCSCQMGRRGGKGWTGSLGVAAASIIYRTVKQSPTV